MDERSYSFMRGVLGEDGARALKKAEERDGRVSTALMPRTILGWLSLAARYEYEGQLPGVDTFLQFRKSESGYSGQIGIGDDVYHFDNASLCHVAGSVAVALGVESTALDPALRDLNLARLGKSIDTLIKARVAVGELERLDKKKKKGEKTEKAEGPGATHKPTEPLEPLAPQEPNFQPAQAAPPKPKTSGIKVTKAQSERACQMCRRPQFQGQEFVGCLCFSSLAKSVDVSVIDDGFSLRFLGESWDLDTTQALLRAMWEK